MQAACIRSTHFFYTATAASVEYLLVTHLLAFSGAVSREVVVLLDRLCESQLSRRTRGPKLWESGPWVVQVVILLMIEILHYLKDLTRWELWYLPYSGYTAGFMSSTVEEQLQLNLGV